MNLLGYSAFDLITGLIQKRKEICKHLHRNVRPVELNRGQPNREQPETAPFQTFQSDNPYGASFSVTTASSLNQSRRKKKGAKKKQKSTTTTIAPHESSFRALENKLLGAGFKRSNQGVVEHALPANAQRKTHNLESGGFWEEIFVPAEVRSQELKEGLASVNDIFPDWAKIPFLPFGVEKLNAMQSQCFKLAFESNANLVRIFPTNIDLFLFFFKKRSMFDSYVFRFIFVSFFFFFLKKKNDNNNNNNNNN
ncbi:hypothetical protein RFI_11281 [Reticulomyxa filosa]|uniref:Uncharacterized protein n=1 Tax=Reticulomyxa filosa TaxID=46433 RepID=X6NHQ3_RETFI|nr:hypothetical protein RFI_11281 [Reticulomyxa filosa]|eukprot:ETO25855.1 hypothetical protein RFI_11281 [Reticulomyxa filosa]